MMKERAAMPVVWRGICGAAAMVSMCGALICGFFILPPKVISEEHVDYSYLTSAELQYRVKLFPNELYDEQWRNEGELYSDLLTDRIEVTLNADFAGSAPAVTEGAYSVTGVVEGYQETKDSQRAIYERRFPLKSGRAEADTDMGAVIRDVISIQPRPYKQAADQADAILGATPARRFYLIFEGSFTADTEYGQAEEPFHIHLDIPIQDKGGFFEIVKPSAVSKQGQLTSESEVRVPADPVKALLIAAWTLVSLAGTVWILRGTRSFNEEEACLRQSKEIMRRYGSHMIRLNHMEAGLAARGTEVADVEALVLLAEEIRRPVCYIPDEQGLPRDGVLYVPDGEHGYVFKQKLPSRPTTTLVVDDELKR